MKFFMWKNYTLDKKCFLRKEITYKIYSKLSFRES